MEINNSHNEQWWIDNYNTKLSDRNEKRFQKWLNQCQSIINHETDTVVHVTYKDFLPCYDLRGWWKDKNQHNWELGFLSAKKYDKPNCPTFSTESIYHGVDGYCGGTWKDAVSALFLLMPGSYSVADIQQMPKTNEFYPSRTNLELVGVTGLIEYFSCFPETKKLILPEDVIKAIIDGKETNLNLN